MRSHKQGNEDRKRGPVQPAEKELFPGNDQA